MKPGHLTMAAVALFSAALIAYQVAIIQFLSLVQWYHYASMVISVALLGFGAAGSLLSLKREWILLHSNGLLPLLIIGCAVTMIMSVEFTRSGSFHSYLLFTDKTQWLRLLLNYILFFIPFFLGALALGIIFTRNVAEIGKIYFSNLSGSGVGALLATIMASWFIPVSLPMISSLLVIITCLLLMRKRNRWLILGTVLPLVVFIFYRFEKPGKVRLSEYKSVSKTMNLPASKVLIQRPGPYGLVQVVSADGLRYAPGLSLAFDKEVPVKKVIFNNGDWFGPVDSRNSTDNLHLLDYTTMALPFILKKRNTALLLNAGCGLGTSHALSNNVSHIDAVEPHRGVAKLLLNELSADNDSLFHLPGVQMHIAEPRSFLSSANKKYDLIQLPLIGAFGGGVGLYAMREEYTLTKEAFLQMWNLLNEDGVISITTWMDYPFRNSLKITATLAEMIEEAGIRRHQDHLAAVRSWATVTYIVKKSSLTDADTSSIRSFCNKYFFDPLLLPGLLGSERMQHNGISDSSFFAYTDQILNGNRNQLYEEYGFHIKPATDDKPYFSQFLRRKSLSQLSAVFGSQNVSFIELGWLIAVTTFLQIALLALLLIYLPLFKLRKAGSTRKSWTLLYFGGIGTGYMFFEIVLIQRFILFFGNPVHAAAVVIFLMLLASGAGSYYSSKFLPVRSVMRKLLLIIFFLLLVYTFSLSPLLRHAASLPGWLLLFISTVIIAVPAFFMGMPFPVGLRTQAVIEERNIPWAWGVNGCMSVISAALATLLTVELGFSMVIIFAALSYGISMLATYLIQPKQV